MEQTATERLKEMNRQERALRSLYADIASSMGLPESAFWVLYAVSDPSANYSQQEISEEWSFSKQTINSAIKLLSKRGYVSLVRFPGCHRAKSIRLTPCGELFVRQYITPMCEAEQAALFEMTSQEQQTYLELTKKHISNLRRAVSILTQHST